MPEPPRIGVITYEWAMYRTWINETKLGLAASWHLASMDSIDALRRQSQKLHSVICLPTWTFVPNAQLVLDGAKSLLIEPQQRQRRVRVEGTSDNHLGRELTHTETGEPQEETIQIPAEEEPIGRVGRDETLVYLQRVYGGWLSDAQWRVVPIERLRHLRELTIQLEAASYREGGNPRVGQLHDEIRALRTEIRNIVDFQESQPIPVPDPVMDVVMDPQTQREYADRRALEARNEAECLRRESEITRIRREMVREIADRASARQSDRAARMREMQRFLDIRQHEHDLRAFMQEQREAAAGRSPRNRR